jgi:hypothetical protein
MRLRDCSVLLVSPSYYKLVSFLVCVTPALSTCTQIVSNAHFIGRPQGCSLGRFDDGVQCCALEPMCIHASSYALHLISQFMFVSLRYYELMSFMVFATPALFTGSIFVFQCLPFLFLHSNCPHMVFMLCSFSSHVRVSSHGHTSAPYSVDSSHPDYLRPVS